MARNFDPGKVAQHGFDFQKMSYFYMMMKKMNRYNSFVYEGKDDFDFHHSEDKSSLYVQVKTGLLTDDKKKDILIYWVGKENLANKYILFFEEQNDFDGSSYVNDVVEMIKDSGGMRKDSNRRIAYDKYLSNGSLDEHSLKNDLKIIAKNIELMTLSCDMMFSDLRNLFLESAENEAVLDSIVENRIYYILSVVIMKIFNELSVSKNANIEYNSNDLINLISEAREKYPFNRYNENYSTIKRGIDINSIIDPKKKEVKQMLDLGLENGEIVTQLINEIFYKGVRSFYVDLKMQEDIFEVEENAFQNFTLTRSKLKRNKDKDKTDLYYEVIEKDINHKIIRELKNSQFASRGCYIYLSSNEAEDEHKIDWEL